MKILDYTHPFPGIKTRLHEKVLWPCYEYTIAIRGGTTFGDNVLESLILQLAEVNVRDSNQLSSMTGLESDLVSFLQDRLLHKGFLDENMCITEEGLAKIKETAVPKTSYYSIFKDAVSGRLLPNIIPMEDQKELVYTSSNISTPEEEHDNIPFFYYSAPTSAGYEETKQKRRALFSIVNSESEKEPSTEEVRDLIYKVLKGNRVDEITFNLGNDSRLTYLMVDLMLQEGNKLSWITSDGFGNITPFFSENIGFLKDTEQKYILGLRRKLDNKVIQDAGFAYKKDSSIGDWTKYPEIGEKLFKLKKLLPQIDKLVKNSDEQRRLYEAKISSVENIYQIIEWILYYHIKENEIYAKKKIQELHTLSTGYVNRFTIGYYIVQIAKEIGFQIGIDTEKLFRVKLGTMKYSMKDGENHELFSLFVLAIAISKDLKNSPIRKLAVEISTLPGLLSELKEERGKAAHSHETNLSDTRITEYYAVVEKILDILFKRKIDTSSYSEKKQTYFDFIQEENIENEAIALLEEKYGYGLINVLPGDYIQVLLEIEKGSIDRNNIMPVVILDEYQLLEKIFHSLQQKTKTIKIYTDYFEYAKNKALNAGFIFDTNKLKVLEKASSGRIEAALNSNDASLQADFLAWLCSESDNNLRQMAQECNDLPFVVNRIAELRGHGELPDKTAYSNLEAIDFTQKINNLIKYLGYSGYFSSENINY